MSSIQTVVPVEQKVVGFDGAEILGVRANNGKIYIGVRGVCDGIGFSEDQARNERRRIQGDIVLCKGGLNLTLPTNGGPQDVLCIDLEFHPLWLAKISITPNMLEYKPGVAQHLVEYQLRAKDVLAKAFLQQPELQANKPNEDRLRIMLLNAQTRHAKLIFDVTRDFRERLSDTAVESLISVGTEMLAGREVVPRPKIEKLYTAGEIAAECGVSANKIGRLAEKHGIKTAEFGITMLDKSPHSSKQVSAFRYNERDREKMRELLREESSEFKSPGRSKV